MSDFLLPDLGEGLTEATVVTWYVAVGDEVALNQPIAEVETAKALVELPSPRAGRVAVLHAAEGETVPVGAPLLGFEHVGANPASAAGEPAADAPAYDAPAADAPASGAPATGAADGDSARPEQPAQGAAPQRQQVLVGYGPVLPGTGRPRRRPRSFPTEPYRSRPEEEAARGRPKALPPVRRHARDLGVDLTAVHGTGPDGRILRADVDATLADGTARTGAAPGAGCACGRSTSGGASTGAARGAAVGGVSGSGAGGGAVGRGTTRVPVTGLRRQTARAMTESAFTAPHASVHTTIDVTDTLERLRGGDRDGRRTSFLAAVCRAVLPAVARTPEANAHFDAEAGVIELYEEVVLGLAVATDRGLVVATVPGAHGLDGGDLTAAIAAQAEKARAGELTPAELTGSTLTLTNVGVFGVDGGTPILNPGQSVILALGAVRTQPWEHHGEVALRKVVTLTLSFDHRVLDGAEASRFLLDVAEVLADPAILLTR